jgi:hypothetical protein
VSPMSPRRKRRAVAVAKMSLHLTLGRKLEGTGVSANDFYALMLLDRRRPWRTWKVRHLPVHVRGPWHRRAVRAFLARQPQLLLTEAGVEVLLTDLERRGLLDGTTVTADGKAVLAQIAARPRERLSRSVVRTDDLDPQLLADTRTVLTDVVEKVREQSRQPHDDGP